MGRWGWLHRSLNLLRCCVVMSVKTDMYPQVWNHPSPAPLQLPGSRNNSPAQGQRWASDSHLSFAIFLQKPFLILLLINPLLREELPENCVVWGSPWHILKGFWACSYEQEYLKMQGNLCNFHRDCLGGCNPRAPLITALPKHTLQLLGSLCSSLRQHHKSQVTRFEVSIALLKSHLSFLGISKKILLPADWIYILSFVLYIFLHLQPLSSHGKEFHANLLRFLWGVVGNRTLLSNGTSTIIWHPSWHFILHIIIYSVM